MLGQLVAWGMTCKADFDRRFAERVAARFLAEKKEIPVYHKKRDRIVYVLPETIEKKPETYERIPEDHDDHVLNKGKPRKPAKPRKPRRPHKPEIPRAVTPAPVKPPEKPKPVKPVPPLKPLKPVKPVKPPTPPKPRRWKKDVPDRYHKVASAEGVVARYLEGESDDDGS